MYNFGGTDMSMICKCQSKMEVLSGGPRYWCPTCGRYYQEYLFSDPVWKEPVYAKFRDSEILKRQKSRNGNKVWSNEELDRIIRFKDGRQKTSRITESFMSEGKSLSAVKGKINLYYKAKKELKKKKYANILNSDLLYYEFIRKIMRGAVKI